MSNGAIRRQKNKRKEHKLLLILVFLVCFFPLCTKAQLFNLLRDTLFVVFFKSFKELAARVLSGLKLSASSFKPEKNTTARFLNIS